MGKWKWFSSCKYAEDGKKLYRDLSRKYHPDNGWKGDELKEVTSEFRAWWEVFKNRHKPQEGHQETQHEEKAQKDINIDAFISIINALSVIPDIEIDIVGSWLWIRGNTYPYKDMIKDAGCRWSAKHKLWYWTECPYTKRHTNNTYQDLKNIFGCETIKPDKRVYLAGASQ